MEKVNLHAAKTHLSSLVDRAIGGEEIVIARAGKPLVRLTPVEPPPVRKLGLMKGVFIIPDDFDDPLPEELFNGPLIPPVRKKRRKRRK